MGNDKRMGAMLTVKEVAQLLHVHPNTLRRWSTTGRIKAYRIAPRGDRRFKYEEITRFLAELNGTTGNWKETGSREQTTGTAGNRTATLPAEPSLSDACTGRRSKAQKRSSKAVPGLLRG